MASSGPQRQTRFGLTRHGTHTARLTQAWRRKQTGPLPNDLQTTAPSPWQTVSVILARGMRFSFWKQTQSIFRVIILFHLSKKAAFAKPLP